MSLTVRELINQATAKLCADAPPAAVKFRLRCGRRTGAAPVEAAPRTLLAPLDVPPAEVDLWALQAAVIRWPAGWCVRGALLDGAGYELGAPHVFTVLLPITPEPTVSSPLTAEHVQTGARNFERLDAPEVVDMPPAVQPPAGQSGPSATAAPAGPTGAAFSALILTIDRLTTANVEAMKANNQAAAASAQANADALKAQTDLAAQVVALARDKEGASTHLASALADVGRAQAGALGEVGRAQAGAVAEVGRSATGTVGPALEAVRAAGAAATEAHEAANAASSFALGQVVEAKVEAARASAGAPPESVEAIEAREQGQTMRDALQLVDKALSGGDLVGRMVKGIAQGNPAALADAEKAAAALAPADQAALVEQLGALLQRIAARGAGNG